MPRCRKILANGKRCKAHAIAGSKFCLFHTPGQRMKRVKKITRVNPPEKSVLQRTSENQLAVRGSKKIGAELVAYGTALKTKPDYTVTYTKQAARYNRQGTVMVGAKTQKTIQPTRSDYGRNFQQTDGKSAKRRRKKVARYITIGRALPILGYSYMGMNMYNAFATGGLTGVQQQHARDWDPIYLSYDIAELIKSSEDAFDWGMMQLKQASHTTVKTPSVGVGFY